MGFVANFTYFPAVQNFENRFRFDKVTESLKVGTFLRHSVDPTRKPTDHIPQTSCQKYTKNYVIRVIICRYTPSTHQVWQ